MALGIPHFRCPRCGSTDVFGREENQYKNAARTAWEAIKFIYLRCNQCDLDEEATTEEQRYDDLRARWTNPDYVKDVTSESLRRGFEETNEQLDRVERERYSRWPLRKRQRRDRAWRVGRMQKVGVDEPYRSRDHFLRVLESPDDDAPRRSYAAWARIVGDSETATFIEAQLALAEGLRNRALPVELERLRERATPAMSNYDAATVYGWGIQELIGDEIVADVEFHRGFVEHVTMNAQDFLDHADEMFLCAPVRYLTLTHVSDLMPRVMESAYLDRIRALAFPGLLQRGPAGQAPYTIGTNALTRADLEAIARSPRLAKLAYLDLADNAALDATGFAAMAMSEGLQALSHVRGVPPAIAAEVERRKGYVPWLHPVDHYRTPEPRADEVVEAPAATWPDVAARRGTDG